MSDLEDVMLYQAQLIVIFVEALVRDDWNGEEAAFESSNNSECVA